MFLGHFAVGLAARPLAPRVPLPVLLLAPQLLDVLWPVLVATGVERARLEPGHLDASALVLEHVPYSHSGLATAGWAALAALAYLAWSRDRRGAQVVAALVVSHWLLDWVAHEPDMPLYPGGPRYGLGLWASRPGTLVTELAMFAAGAWRYTRATVARGSIGRWGWPALAAILAIGFVGSTLGPPPPSLDHLLLMVGVALAGVLGAAIAIERQRPSRPRGA